jgi:hypothetical protein
MGIVPEVTLKYQEDNKIPNSDDIQEFLISHSPLLGRHVLNPKKKLVLFSNCSLGRIQIYFLQYADVWLHYMIVIAWYGHMPPKI